MIYGISKKGGPAGAQIPAHGKVAELVDAGFISGSPFSGIHVSHIDGAGVYGKRPDIREKYNL